MTQQTVKWLNCYNGDVHVAYRYDDGGILPPGTFTGFTWVNNTANKYRIGMFLELGKTAAELSIGTVTALVTSVGILNPVWAARPILALNANEGVLKSFTATLDVLPGLTTIAVTSTNLNAAIPAGTRLMTRLPYVYIPRTGDTVALDSFLGGGTNGADDLLNISSLGIPMQLVGSEQKIAGYLTFEGN